MTELAETALENLRIGLPIFPVQPNGKKPLIKWRAYQERLPTEEEVTRWWQTWRTANVGLVTGRLSFVVVDCDSPQAVVRFLRSHPETTNTRRSRTGRGEHFFFQFEAGIRNTSGLLGEGIDVRGEGGFVVLPPSVHSSGRRYEWLNDREALPLPESLRQILSCCGERGFSRESGEAGAGRIPEGQRNSTLTSLAGAMRKRGFSGEAIAAALHAENKSRCDEPLSEAEVKRIASSVAKYPPDLKFILSSTPADPKVKEEAKKSDLVLVNLADVQREEVQWIWEGRIPRGKLTLFDGDPGQGKSCMSLSIAAALTRGTALPGGEGGLQGRVLILTAEDGLSDTVRPRLEDMGAELSQVVVLEGVRDERGRERGITLKDVQRLDEALAEVKPVLVIVDPVIAFFGGKNEWRAGEVRSLLAPLAGLAEKHDVAVILIRHLNKGAEKTIYRGQGSMDFLAACRAAFLICEDPNDSAVSLFCHVKASLGPKSASVRFSIRDGVSYGGPKRSIRFFWEGESLVTADEALAHVAKEEGRTELTTACDFLLEILAEGPMASTEILKQAKLAGHSERTLWRAKDTLGVKADKKGPNGAWRWVLPEEA